MANRNSIDRKIDSAKLNVEVCSILLATISISFGLSDLSKLFYLTRLLIAICLGSGGLFLIISIVLEADAVFEYSRGSEDRGDFFDLFGYRCMKFGLLFSLITLNYLVSPFIPVLPFIPATLSICWSQLCQVVLPLLFAAIPFSTWRIFKNRKLGRRWYRIW